MDAWIALTDGGQLYGGGSGITGWFLASWSNDAAIWNRAVVLYAFGLSLHYFVWIKAIPESLSVLDRPNSFRASLGHLRRDLGRNTLALSACVAGAGMLVWSLSFPLGSAIYFDLALLHAWVELLSISLVLILHWRVNHGDWLADIRALWLRRCFVLVLIILCWFGLK